LLTNKAKEASLDERLGFNADKNINLKDWRQLSVNSVQ
jgi:hypothetical protein